MSSWLKRRRRASGWTQIELAHRIGVRFAVTVADWERGSRRPAWSQVVAIAQIFGVAETYAAKQLGWIRLPGRRCSCGCGGSYVQPPGRRGAEVDVPTALGCAVCGRVRVYRAGERHIRLCSACANRARAGVKRAPRVTLACVGYDYFGRTRHVDNCSHSVVRTVSEIQRRQSKGAYIDQLANRYRCARCTRAMNLLRGDTKHLERLYNKRFGQRLRGSRPARIQSASEYRRFRRALIITGDLHKVGWHDRTAESHTAEAKRRISRANLLRVWTKREGPRSVVLRRCALCGLLLMIESERLAAGKRGLFHRPCADRWRRAIGQSNSATPGRRLSVPLPNARRGRKASEAELRDHFRWLVLHRIGGMTYRALAALIAAESGAPASRSTVQKGVGSIIALLPDSKLANLKLRQYLTAFAESPSKV